MTFCIITQVEHIKKENTYFSYSPYVKEINLWLKYTNKIIVVAPLINKSITAIHDQYIHSNLVFKTTPNFSLTNFKNILTTIFVIPKILFTIFKAMKQADHIHLRCPGNMGLLGAIVQIMFPKKPKTAKYAGNWDPKSKQPWSYKLQKWILSNPFLTRNMQVLVYGEWKNQTKNIKPFFTASYSESEKKPVIIKNCHSKIEFVFVGTLSIGKQPLYAIKIVENLLKKGYDVNFSLFGEGKENDVLTEYIEKNQLSNAIFLKGNNDKETIKEVYQKSHFLILPSKSEGWPKVVAEAMFWGCLPIATPVSCVPNMLDYEERGILLTSVLEKDIQKIEMVIQNSELYSKKINKAVEWSRNFAIDTFENEIKQLLQQ